MTEGARLGLCDGSKLAEGSWLSLGCKLIDGFAEGNLLLLGRKDGSSENDGRADGSIEGKEEKVGTSLGFALGDSDGANGPEGMPKKSLERPSIKSPKPV